MSYKTFKGELFGFLSILPDLSALIGTRLYPGMAPTGAALPLIVYSRLSADPVHRLSLGSSVSANGLTLERFDMAIFGRTDLECEQVKDVLRNELDGLRVELATISVRRIFLRNTIDSAPGPIDGSNDAEYRQNVGLDIWYCRPNRQFLLTEAEGFVTQEQESLITVRA